MVGRGAISFLAKPSPLLATKSQKVQFSSPILQWNSPCSWRRSNHAQTQMLRSLGTSLLNGNPPPAGSRIMYGVGPMPRLWLRLVFRPYVFTIVIPTSMSRARSLHRLPPPSLPTGFFLLPWHAGFHFLDLRVSSVCPGPTPCRASHLTIGSLDRRDVLLVVICHGTAPTPLRCHKWNMQRISSLLGPHDIDLPLIRPQLCPQPIIAFPRIVDLQCDDDGCYVRWAPLPLSSAAAAARLSSVRREVQRECVHAHITHALDWTAVGRITYLSLPAYPDEDFI